MEVIEVIHSQLEDRIAAFRRISASADGNPAASVAGAESRRNAGVDAAVVGVKTASHVDVVLPPAVEGIPNRYHFVLRTWCTSAGVRAYVSACRCARVYVCANERVSE